MRLRDDPETERFREELVCWLEAHRPRPEEMQEPSLSSAHIPAWGRRWQRTLFEHGWLVPGWPPELGGRRATPVQQLVYFEELSRRQIPRAFNPQGLSIITPSIVDFGTKEQVERFAIPTLKAEITWCLGMSEPDAGSDLAGLRTRAELVGDHFVVNGQKVWTSGAHHADYCFCFVRTDPEAPKHRGISVLIIDMRSPGVSHRPIPELTDPEHADFNEVFFTDVVVPKDHLVGELNQGWSIAGGSLAHERGMLWVDHATGIERAIEAALALARDPRPAGRLADDARVRDELVRCYVEAQAFKALGYRGFAKFAAGLQAPEHSILKLVGSELQRRLALVVTEALGPEAVELPERDRTTRLRRDERPWAHRYLGSFAGTIAGGTSEIQRTIIAQRVLGLPRP